MSTPKREYLVTVTYAVQAASRDAAERCAKAITDDNGASLSTPSYSWQASHTRRVDVSPSLATPK